MGEQALGLLWHQRRVEGRQQVDGVAGLDVLLLVERVDRAEREALVSQRDDNGRAVQIEAGEIGRGQFFLAARVGELQQALDLAAIGARFERAYQVPGLAALGELDRVATAQLDQHVRYGACGERGQL